jgi:hypothetical protein
MKKKQRKQFVRFVERLHEKNHVERCAIIDAKVRTLREQGGNRKTVKGLLALLDFLEQADHVAQKMPRSRVVPPAAAFAGSGGIRFGA